MLAERLGGVVSAGARLAMMGTPELDTMAILYRDLGLSTPDPEADRRFVAERMVELYAADLTWRPGAKELVDVVQTEPFRVRCSC